MSRKTRESWADLMRKPTTTLDGRGEILKRGDMIRVNWGTFTAPKFRQTRVLQIALIETRAAVTDKGRARQARTGQIFVGAIHWGMLPYAWIFTEHGHQVDGAQVYPCVQPGEIGDTGPVPEFREPCRRKGCPGVLTPTHSSEHRGECNTCHVTRPIEAEVTNV